MAQPEPAPDHNETSARDVDGGALAEFFAALLMALRFFSRLPLGNSPHRRPSLERMAPVLPLASLVIGLGPAAVVFGTASAGLPAGLAAVLGIVVMVLVSGAMADDALADSADGLFGGQTAQRRLEIMRDSRHGSYGVLAIVAFFALRIFAYMALLAGGALAGACIMLAASVLGRSGGLWVAVCLPAARQDGAGAVAGEPGALPVLVGTCLAIAIALILAVPFAGFAGWMAALGLGLLAVIGWMALCRRLVGGQTGDLLGASMALCESAALIGFVLFA